jgi:hypothetical protein
MSTARPAFADASPDPRLERALRRLVLFGGLAVALFPSARGHSAWLGSLPLWLLAMPLSSWWALHRFRLPRLHAPAGAARRRRRGTAQARRQQGPRARQRIARAA